MKSTYRQIHQRDVCIVIPAFNEEDTIARVIVQLQKNGWHKQIVVINDGSSDATGKIAQQCGVIVIHLPVNVGIGGAVQTGLKFAVAKGFRAAIQVDADGQHDPDEITRLLKAWKPGVSLVIGSRFNERSQYQGTIVRRFGISFFSWLINMCCGYKIYDITSGFRLYADDGLIYLADHYPIDFPEPESLVDLLQGGATVVETPVRMKIRQGGVSSVSPIKGLYLFITISLVILMSVWSHHGYFRSTTR
jgi:glycosyltransferase involved in cell wall biosynthesis